MKPSYRRQPKGRPHRVAELLRERLALILLHKCADPRLADLTLTEVEISSDLKQARAFYVVRQGAELEAVQAALDKALGYIKQELAQEHLLRVMPEITFRLDDTYYQTERLEELFREMGKNGTEDK